MSSLAAIVLDRDGTVIEDRHYIRSADDVVFLPGAIEALKDLKQKGYPIFLVSNQSGVGRGWIQDAEFQTVHRSFVEKLRDGGVELDEIAYCFHSPDDDCLCRKPRTGLVPRSFRDRSIDWSRSYVVGDHLPDLGLGEALGANTCLVLTGKGRETLRHLAENRVQVFENLMEFAASLTPSGN